MLFQVRESCVLDTAKTPYSIYRREVARERSVPYWSWYRTYRLIDHYTIAVLAQHGCMYEVPGTLGHM